MSHSETGSAPSLETTFQTVHGALRQTLDPHAAGRRLGADETRLRYYSRAVKGHVENILYKNYPALADVLGPDRFGALVEAFYGSFPPHDYELNENAAAFRALLTEARETGRFGVTPFHVELAELEWQEFVAYVSSAKMPDPARLAQPTLNPTLSIVQFEFPVTTYLEAWQALTEHQIAPSVPETRDPETVFVWRDPQTENAAFAKADDALLFAFKISHDSLSTAQAAEQTGISLATVQQLLEAAADRGVVILPRPLTKETSP